MYTNKGFKLGISCITFVLLNTSFIFASKTSSATRANISRNNNLQSVASAKNKNSKNVFSLAKTLKIASASHPSVLSAFYEMKAEKHALNAAKAKFLPSVDFESGYQFNKEPTTFFNDSTDGSKQSDSGINFEASLNYNVLSGGADMFALKEASTAMQAAVVAYHGARMSIMLETGGSYITKRKFQRLIKLYKNNLKQHADFLKMIKSRIKAGKLAKDAEHATVSKMEEARYLLLAGKKEAAFKEIELNEATGMKNIEVVSAKIPDDLLPTSYDEAARILMVNNISILEARYNYKKAGYACRKAAAGSAPTIDVTAGYSYESTGYGGIAAADASDSQDFSAGLECKWTIEGGMLDKIRIAESKRKKAYYTMMLAIRKSKAALKTDWTERNTLIGKITSAKSNVLAKKKLMEGQMYKFKLGRATLLSVLNRISEYIQSKTQLITLESELDELELKILTTDLCVMHRLMDQL